MSPPPDDWPCKLELGASVVLARRDTGVPGNASRTALTMVGISSLVKGSCTFLFLVGGVPVGCTGSQSGDRIARITRYEWPQDFPSMLDKNVWAKLW